MVADQPFGPEGVGDGPADFVLAVGQRRAGVDLSHPQHGGIPESSELEQLGNDSGAAGA